ncbi:unnamed protein product [Rotaria sordida]|uniref:Uncharacterized protein n=1 Tax=Rotaria sordida TaxID=392033 RepID=A0A814YT82_9BILA|nr:unnamed protein product [Rotaria sordida]CAF1516471.1 unnamed protein product [Rotaria sordida]
MLANKTEVKNYSTTNNVEYLTSPSTCTVESFHSSDFNITSDPLTNWKETYQNSLSSYDVDELTNQLGVIDYSKCSLDRQDSNSEHIQHNNNAQIPYEQDTTMENLKSPISLSSDSVTNDENHSSKNSSLISTHEYSPVQSPINSPHIVATVEQQESLPQKAQSVIIENWSSYETSSERSVTVEQIQQLIQRVASESTAYTYDVPHTDVVGNFHHIITIIKDPHMYDAQNDSNIVSNGYVIDTEPTFSMGNDNVQMTHMEPTPFSSITNHYHDFQVIDSNVNSQPLITYEKNDESNTSQLIIDENGEYIEIPAEEIILPDECHSNTNDVYQSNVLHEEYIYN